MMRLEDIKTGTILRGIRPSKNVTAETVESHGFDGVKVSADSSAPNSGTGIQGLLAVAIPDYKTNLLPLLTFWQASIRGGNA